jgi:hypothetical protein
MAWIAHMVIAGHAGTSREMVSAQMERLRKLGVVRYSRTFTDVDCEAVEQVLLNSGQAL